jgi:hypothetical protein
MQRHRGFYPCGTPRPVGPTRRQFVQGMLVGAAAAGCAGKPAMMTGPIDAAPSARPPPIASCSVDRHRDVAPRDGQRHARLGRLVGSDAPGHRRLRRRADHGYSQGLTFFETADQYGAHPHIAEAIRQVGRQNVVVLTKTAAQTAPARRPIWIASAASWAST